MHKPTEHKPIAILSLLWSTHLPILLDYLANLPDTRPRTVFVLASIADTPQDVQKFAALGVTLHRIEGPLSDQNKHTINQYQSKTLAQLTLTFRSQAWRTFCQNFHVPFTETTATISKRLTQSLSRIEVFLTWLNNIQQRYNIELLLCSEDVLMLTRTAILWAKPANIPTLHIQHGPQLLRPHPVHDQDFSPHMSVYGTRGKQAHARFTYGTLYCVGNHCWAIYRRYARQKKMLREKITQQYALKDQPIILFGTTWTCLLSAHVDTQIHTKTLTTMFQALKHLQTRGIQLTLIIKDRIANAALEQHTHVTQTLAAACGLNHTDYVYTTQDTERLISAADILVSSDSTLSVEAMHTLTPAINLDVEWGIMRGSTFHAEDGILSLSNFNPIQLADMIEALLFDQPLRAAQIKKMHDHVTLYNITAHTGNALSKATSVIKRICTP